MKKYIKKLTQFFLQAVHTYRKSFYILVAVNMSKLFVSVYIQSEHHIQIPNKQSGLFDEIVICIYFILICMLKIAYNVQCMYLSHMKHLLSCTKHLFH